MEMSLTVCFDEFGIFSCDKLENFSEKLLILTYLQNAYFPPRMDFPRVMYFLCPHKNKILVGGKLGGNEKWPEMVYAN
jgi:hypothetical protein